MGQLYPVSALTDTGTHAAVSITASTEIGFHMLQCVTICLCFHVYIMSRDALSYFVSVCYLFIINLYNTWTVITIPGRLQEVAGVENPLDGWSRNPYG